MVDHITTLETMLALPILLVEMILINFQGCIWRDIQILEHKLVIPIDMINLLLATTLLIEVLDTINMALSLKSHIFLIMDHQTNHFSQYIQVIKNSFNYILTMGIIVLICILVVGLIMMILSLLIIQYEIDCCIICLLVKMLLYLK